MAKRQTSDSSTLEHIGILVKDMDKAALFYSKALGIEPFKVYALDTGEAKIKVGLATKGDVIMELIEVSEGTSVYNQFPGVSAHIGFLVKDLEKELARAQSAGCEVVLKTHAAESAVAFLRSEGATAIIQLLQTNTEIYERLEGIGKRLK